METIKQRHKKLPLINNASPTGGDTLVVRFLHTTKFSRDFGPFEGGQFVKSNV